MTDDTEPTKAELAQRVEQLESILFSNRRTVVAGLLGLGGGAALTGGGAAADTSVGSAGAPNASQDIYLDEILDPTGDQVADLDDSGLFAFVRGLDLPEVAVDGDQALLSRPVSGQVQLSSGAATVDTGLSATDATFYLALGIDDPNADAKIAGRLFWDDSAGTYHIEIVEDGTSVGNPTVNYDVLRVR